MKRMVSAFTLPPTGLVLLSIGSMQLGAAIAKSLLPIAHPLGVVLLRVGFAAIVLIAWQRPQLSDRIRTNLGLLVAFGCALASMNLCFYTAIERIPLGVGVALEFIGPLGVSIVYSRRLLDVLWVVLAGVGILLLTPLTGTGLDPLGLGLALLAGSLWAAYILLTARVGRVIAGNAGLTWAMAIAAVILLPVGVLTEGTALLQPHLLLVGFGVALLSSAIPYSLELEALRGLSVQVFGILLSIEPVVAALAGLLVLRETLKPEAIAAIILITLAAAGASRFAPQISDDNQPH